MITEPELDGEWGTARSAESAEALAPRERAAGGSRPWLWALGGALVASALWAGGLHAFGDRLAGPALSYRTTKNLCDDFASPALNRITGDLHKSRPVNHEYSHPAVDGAFCSLTNGGDRPDFSVDVQVDLHKKTDPSVEFDVPSFEYAAGLGDVRREAVPGLGERAVMTASAGEQFLVLKVLDGGAVFTVKVFVSTYAERNERPATDATAVQAALIADTRDLITALKE
ncbi:hypothetical protein AB0D94_20395 [Streptomyces sp. NPDC048255]|uniref:hypothetical protein n=1 Tax=Streptomyces sp. NPDC048255 TaxID=3154713 RepID=UPI0033D0C12A